MDDSLFHRNGLTFGQRQGCHTGYCATTEGSAVEIVRFEQSPVYGAAGHDDVVARRLQGGEATSADFVLVGHSQFPPGATVPMDASPISKIYVVVEGVITIEQSDGTRHRLSRWDSVLVPANEARAVVNDSSASASIIVVTPPAVA